MIRTENGELNKAHRPAYSPGAFNVKRLTVNAADKTMDAAAFTNASTFHDSSITPKPFAFCA